MGKHCGLEGESAWLVLLVVYIAGSCEDPRRIDSIEETFSSWLIDEIG